MQIILLEKIDRLGDIGSQVTVRDGYARNFLLPYKKALRATKENIAYFEAEKAELMARNEAARKEAETEAEKFAGLKLVIVRQAGDTGHLYGSVTAANIAESLKNKGVKADSNQVKLDKPIKEIGIYEAKVSLHPEVVRVVKLVVARSEEDADNIEKAAAISKEKAEIEAKKAAAKSAKAEEVADEALEAEASAEADAEKPAKAKKTTAKKVKAEEPKTAE